MKKKILTTILSIICVVCFSLFFVACNNKDNTAEEEHGSAYSEGLEYSLDLYGLGYTVIGKGSCSDTNIVIPSTYQGLPVTSIGSSAFYDCSSLTSVVIPDSVTSIGERAFAYCDSLTSVVIGDSVTSIGSSAFEGCYSLTSVNYLGTIDQWVQIECFDYGSNPLCYAKKLYINGELLTEANITTATKINAYAFYNCTSLTSVVIGDSVISIGDFAFGHCTSLTSVVIPDSVTSIGWFAFRDCTSLTSVYYLGTIDQWVQIKFVGLDSNPLYYAKKLYINGELLTEANITTATKINAYVFRNCTALTSIIIPDSVTSIGDEAFYACTSLTSVYYSGTKEDWDNIWIGNSNTKLTSATRYYYIENESDLPNDNGKYWHYVDGVPTIWN